MMYYIHINELKPNNLIKGDETLWQVLIFQTLTLIQTMENTK